MKLNHNRAGWVTKKDISVVPLKDFFSFFFFSFFFWFLRFNPLLPPPLVPWWRLHSTGYTLTHAVFCWLLLLSQTLSLSAITNKWKVHSFFLLHTQKRCASYSSHFTGNLDKGKNLPRCLPLNINIWFRAQSDTLLTKGYKCRML